MRFAPIVLAGLILAAAAQAGMAQDIRIGSSLENLPDSEIDARLRFLEERLDAGRFTASAWQYGWTGIYATTTVVSAAQTLTADDGDARVVGIVGAVKSAGAVAQLLIDPLPARLGAAPMREVAAGTRQGRLERLAVGERQLVANAVRADSRYSLQRHLEGVTTNLIGGAVIWALGDSTDAVVSILSGIAFSEAQIWSQPWRAVGDLGDYRSTFPTTTAMPGIEWQLRPMPNGVQLAFRF